MKNLMFFLLLQLTWMTNGLNATDSHSRQLNNSTSKKKVQTIVIISCSGKAGSTTLEHSFKQLNIETYRFHNLNPDWLKKITVGSKNNHVVFIDSYRDILSRKIASYFQNIGTHTKMDKTEILLKYEKEGVDFLLKDFGDRLLRIEQYHTFNDWKILNYDCLKDGVFDFKKKYQLTQIGNCYFINFRFNDIKNWTEIIKSIDLPLDLTHFNILSSNISINKWYYNIYKDFLAKFTLSQTSFDAILSQNAEEIAHFFTKKEIRDFKNKWKSHIEN